MTGLPGKFSVFHIWIWSTVIAVSIGLAALPAHSVEVDVDRPGLDYRNFDVNDPTYYACQRACKLDARCRAWTYVKPGYQGPKPRCWLKSAEPGLRTAPCCHSGVKNDGSDTATIRQVQSILAKYGYDPGPIDGKLGRQTVDAIRRFQASHALIEDGRITAPLRDALWDLWRKSWANERTVKETQEPAPSAPQVPAPVTPSASSIEPAEDLSDLDALD